MTPTHVQPVLGWLGREAVSLEKSAIYIQRKPFLQSFLQVFSIWRQITHPSCRSIFSHLKSGGILLAAIALSSCNEISLVISLFQLLKRKLSERKKPKQTKPNKKPQQNKQANKQKNPPKKHMDKNHQPHTASSALGCRTLSLPINEADWTIWSLDPLPVWTPLGCACYQFGYQTGQEGGWGLLI